MSISEHMTSEHKRCDLLYLEAEKAVIEADWERAHQQYGKFHQAMKQHFEQEESVLFPDFEQVHGSQEGPTQVMRMEHEQMLSLMDDIQKALEHEDKDEFLGEADTFLVYMQQHNAKEEMMLYPMTDQVLAAQSGEVISRMQALVEAQPEKQAAR